MIKVILGIVVVGVLILSASLFKLRHEVIRHADVFAVGACYRSEEMGVIYRYEAGDQFQIVPREMTPPGPERDPHDDKLAPVPCPSHE